MPRPSLTLQMWLLGLRVRLSTASFAGPLLPLEAPPDALLCPLACEPDRARRGAMCVRPRNTSSTALYRHATKQMENNGVREELAYRYRPYSTEHKYAQQLYVSRYRVHHTKDIPVQFA